MKYLIENKVIYNSASGEFCIIGLGVAEKQRLTSTANQIFALLIASHGQVVERDNLLEKVWELHGHPGSNASLNQYISILRKKLTSLIGIDDVIITAPRIGFILSPDLHIELYEEENTKKDTPIKKINKPLLKLALYISPAVIILLFIPFLFKIKIPIFNKETARVLNSIEQCQISAYSKTPKQMAEMLVNIINKIYPGLQKRCRDNPAKLMIYVQRRIYYGKEGRVFSSFCPTDKENNNIIYCNNIYINKWRYHDK